MKRKLMFVMVLALAALVAGCNGNVSTASATNTPEASNPTPTLPPTAVPTAIPSPIPTEVPTEEPTPVPTEVPTVVPTPTEIPLYVGMSGGKIWALRTQCLLENPDSFCLPLPVDPTFPGVVLEEWEGVISIYSPNNTVVEIVAPVPGFLEVERNGDKPGVLLPDRTGVLDFDIGFPKFELIVYRYTPSSGTWGFFADAEIESLAQGNQTVDIGDLLVTIKGPYFLYFKWKGDLDEQGYWRWNTLADLLRNESGSIVYVLPAQTEADLP